MGYLIALDQGTTSSRAVVFRREGSVAASANMEFKQIYPRPGWVEHDPMDILSSQMIALRAAVEKANITPGQIEAIGVTNQRETTVVWEKDTGKPVCNAIVWQCRRTAALCEQLKKDGWTEKIRERTGLIVDAYFSGTKLKWILDNVPGARVRAEKGELLFGTVDSWLIYRLSGGRLHVTDYSNASRTMLFNIRTLTWDDEILSALDIPRRMLPRVVPSSGVVGMTDPSILGREIPIAGIAGDQHAALFGQACFGTGIAKNTYGTGCFMLMNTGDTPVNSANRLLTTIAWGIGGRVEYALEGSIFIAGAAVQWLRDEMGLIRTSAESEKVALSIPDNGGVYLVPAFSGLGAPYWDMYSRGTIVGLTRGTGRAHIVRAALEAIAYQSCDVTDAMQQDSGLNLSSMRVDGGASANNFLMQFQADMLGVEVSRPQIIETTALGAAQMAALGVGLYQNCEELNERRIPERIFYPAMDEKERQARYAQWKRAVERARGWIVGG